MRHAVRFSGTREITHAHLVVADANGQVGRCRAGLLICARRACRCAKNFVVEIKQFVLAFDAAARFGEQDTIVEAMRTSAESMATQQKSLLSLVQTNAQLEEQEKPLRGVVLNRILIGNPGTGKTTVGKLYGEILKSLGMLSKGDVVMKTPQDFVGSALGESEKKTKAILENTKGCVRAEKMPIPIGQILD